MNHFEKSLLQELDFKQEVKNAERTADNFKHHDYLYIPKPMVLKCTYRTIIMEFVEGDRIDDLETLKRKYGSAKETGDLLV